jgi:hypothetical protein
MNDDELLKEKAKVLLRPTVSQPVCLDVKHPLGPKNRFLLLSNNGGFVDAARSLSVERTNLSYIIAAGPRQRSNSRALVPRGS